MFYVVRVPTSDITLFLSQPGVGPAMAKLESAVSSYSHSPSMHDVVALADTYIVLPAADLYIYIYIYLQNSPSLLSRVYGVYLTVRHYVV